MDTLTAIQTRRAVRSWTDQVVPEELLQKILQAGRYAPSPLNSQPWHFTVIRDKKTLGLLMAKAYHGTFMTLADTLIVVTVRRDAHVDDWLASNLQHVYAGVCALENMWLAATDLGLGGCWVSLDEQWTHEVLTISENHVIIGSLAVGYAKTPPVPHSEGDRNMLRDIISYEVFQEE